jgi:flagellar motor switch protein FliN/FliY
MSDQPQSAQNVTPEELEAAIAAAKAEAAPGAAPSAVAAPAQPESAPTSTAQDAPTAASTPAAGFASQEEDLLKQAAHGPESEPSTSTAAKPFVEPDLSAVSLSPELANLELLDDVDLDVKIELGRTQMFIEDVLRLGPGSVVPLDKLAGDPVDIYVNDRLVARGEVLVLNDNFCVRINDILSPTPELETSA